MIFIIYFYYLFGTVGNWRKIKCSAIIFVKQPRTVKKKCLSPSNYGLCELRFLITEITETLWLCVTCLLIYVDFVEKFILAQHFLGTDFMSVHLYIINYYY
jgi:hypothetical protein